MNSVTSEIAKKREKKSQWSFKKLGHYDSIARKK